MAEFFRIGGFSMWIVLLFGGMSLVVGARFAWRAEPRRLAILRASSWATAFAVLSGLSANLMAVMFHVTGRDDWAHDPDVHLIVMRGLGESLAPAVLGFTMLSLAWFLVAVGTRRLQDSD